MPTQDKFKLALVAGGVTLFALLAGCESAAPAGNNAAGGAGASATAAPGQGAGAITNASPASVGFFTPPKKGAYYTVVPGDTVLSITRKLSVDRKALLTLNNLGDGGRLVPGQKLLIPLQGGTPADSFGFVKEDRGIKPSGTAK